MADTTVDTTGATLPEPDPVQMKALMDGIVPPTGGTVSPTPGLFTSNVVQPPGTATGPFTANANDSSNTIAGQRYSDGQATFIAALGGLAQQRLGLAPPPADPGDGGGRLANLIAMNQATIDAGQEKLLRKQLDAADRTNTRNNLIASQNAVLDMGAGPNMPGLMDLMNLQFANESRPENPDTLEINGVARLQAMAAQDPNQAAIMADLQKNGDLLDRMRDNVTKMVLFNRDLDVVRQARQDQGWIHDAADFASNFIPFKDFLSRTGNVDSKNIPNISFWDWPATRQNKEIAALWNMPVDQFRQALPDVFNKFTSTEFGLGHDYTKALEVAGQFAGRGLNNSDALSFNVWTSVDVLGMLPLEKMALVPSKAARLLGNRVVSADIVSSTLASEIHGVQTGFEGLEAPAHAIEESLPSSMVPDTQSLIRPDIGVAGDVADRLKAIRESVTATQAGLAATDRLAPAQVREAVERAVKDVQLAYRDDPVADLKAEAFGRVPDREPFDEPIPDNSPRMLLDPEADMDNLSYINARGEVYNTAEDLPSFSTTPANIAREHLDDVTAAETEAYRRIHAGQLASTEAAAEARAAFEARTTEGEVGGIRSIPELSRNPDTGIYSLNFYLGKRYASGGFLTKEGAEAAAVRRGFSLDHVGIHQNTDGQWFIKVKQAVREDGITKPVLKEADFPDLGIFPRMSRAVLSADNIMPEMFNQARIGQTIMKSRLNARVFAPYVANIRKLSKKSARLLSKVLAVGERDQKWFTSGEFEAVFERAAGRLPTKAEMLAYYSAKELSDLNYHMLNNSLYAAKARRGVQTVRAHNDAIGFDTGRVNGRVVEKPDFNSIGRIYDLDEGITKNASDVADLQRKFDTGNYHVIDLERPHTRPGEDPVKRVLAHRASSELSPLERSQLGYVEGGAREHRFKWFVKQAQQGTFEDGSKYWLNPKTHIAAPTRKAAKAWADSMEAGRQAYFNPDMDDALKRAIIDRTPMESYEQFEDLVNRGIIQKDHPFEALFDRQMPTAMTHLGEDAVKFIDPETSGFEDYAIDRGRMYYSKKGEDRLMDPTGEYAQIMDPFTTLHNAMQNAAQTFAFGDYNTKVIEEWSRVATPYIDKNSVGRNFEPTNVFYNGKLSQDFYKANPEFYNKLEATRNTHKRLLGMKDNDQRMLDTAKRRIAGWIENKGQWGEAMATRLLDRDSANPVNAIRGMVFDAKLGFFDPSQLLVQTQTAAAALAIDPANGARTMGMMLPMAHLMTNTSENVLDYYAKALRSVHGLSVDDFKDMVRSLRNSGWMNVGGEVVQLDRQLNTMGGNAIAKAGSRFREAGRFFFNLAEKFNRLTAYQMAWKATRDALPDAKVGREFLGMVNKKADDYSMNMTSSSAAFWQKGILSLPTQFMAYQMRTLENILPKTFLGVRVGSSRFSAGQKVRLLASQMLFYGAAGFPGGHELMNWIGNEYQRANGQPLDPAVWRAMSKGLWDSVVHGLTGEDTDFAHRAGQGGAWTDVYNKLTNGDMNSFLDVIGGASGAVTGSTIDTLFRIKDYMVAEQTIIPSQDDLQLYAGDIAKQISLVNHLTKAYWVWKMGVIKDPKSGEYIGVNHQDFMATALGIPLRKETERWDIIHDDKARQDTIRDMGKLIAMNRRAAFEALADGDLEKQNYYNKLASGLMMSYRDDPLLEQAIAAEANHQLGYTQDDWNNLITKHYQHTGLQPNGGN